MLNFPMPYQDELIYSTVARYGVHFGITSPKQLLDEVYGNRKLIATTDLPNHLSVISKHFLNCHQPSTEYLAYNHTLFPLYAPFVPEKRRKECLRLMASSSQGAIHLALGVAASRVKQKSSLRYCPQCVQLQQQQHGEYFWQRLWQINGADCCLLHGELRESSVERHSYHRHQFFAPSPENCPDIHQNESQNEGRIVTNQVEKLLKRPLSKSADRVQWTLYYRILAGRKNCLKGLFIQYDKIVDRVLQCWSAKWLEDHGLSINRSESCWLKGIFRKHRKSFCYLEHIVVLQSFLTEPWDISIVLDEVGRMPHNTHSKEPVLVCREVSVDVKNKYQKSWEVLVKREGVKLARKQDQGGSIYAWLYRYDRYWLLQINSQYRINQQPVNKRVNWQKKDKQTVRKLIQIRNQCEELLDQPQMTRNWYFSQIQSPSTIEKNLYKMPLCRQFFFQYCESTTDHQIRRITRVAAQMNVPLSELARWKVLRLSGLNDKRIKKRTKEFLTKIMEV